MFVVFVTDVNINNYVWPENNIHKFTSNKEQQT